MQGIEIAVPRPDGIEVLRRRCCDRCPAYPELTDAETSAGHVSREKLIVLLDGFGRELASSHRVHVQFRAQLSSLRTIEAAEVDEAVPGGAGLALRDRTG